MKKGDTRWSESVDGDAGNYGWHVKFSETDGYVTVYQQQDADTVGALLSPAQVRALVAFVAPKRRRPRSPSATDRAP